MSYTAAEIARIDQRKAAVRDRLDRLVEHAREHLESGACRAGDCPGLDVVTDLKHACPDHNVALLAMAVARLAQEGLRP